MRMSEPTQPFNETKYDEVEIEPTVGVVDQEAPSSQAEHSSSIGCYYSPGKILFHIRLTDVVAEEAKAENEEHSIIEGEQDRSGVETRFDEVELEQQELLEDEAGYDQIDIEPEDLSIDPANLSGEFDVSLSGEFGAATMPLGSVDQMLAEVSFIEGHESLAQGDRTGAIWHYNNAISYAPDKIEFYLKLAEVFAEDPNTCRDAERLLIKAIKTVTDNYELRVRLTELRKQRKQSQGSVRQKRSEGRPKRKRSQNAAGLKKKNDPEEIIKEIAELERKTAADLMRHSRRRKLRSRRVNHRSFMSADKMLPEKLSRRKWAILAIIFLAILIGTEYVLSYRGEIVPIIPIKDSNFDAKDLQFQWDCNVQNLTFVLEVYDKGELVMRQFTKERSYRPDLNQKSFFEAGNTYNWVVHGAQNIKKGYQFSTEPQSFSITKAVELPLVVPVVEPPAQINPQQSDQPPRIVTPLPDQGKRID
jgi:hypothetical protein